MSNKYRKEEQEIVWLQEKQNGLPVLVFRPENPEPLILQTQKINAAIAAGEKDRGLDLYKEIDQIKKGMKFIYVGIVGRVQCRKETAVINSKREKVSDSKAGDLLSQTEQWQKAVEHYEANPNFTYQELDKLRNEDENKNEAKKESK